MPNYRAKGEAAKALRKEAGKYLKACRTQAGMTQIQAATEMGQVYFTFVSQLEQGRHRLAPEQWAELARIYGQDVKKFATTLLAYYDPSVYACIFGDQEPPGVETIRTYLN